MNHVETRSSKLGKKGQEVFLRLEINKDSLTGGTPVMVEEKKIGLLTSLTMIEEKPFGLAYVRTKAGGVGLSVQIGAFSGELVDLPYLNHRL